MYKFVISMAVVLSVTTLTKVHAQKGFSFSIKGSPQVSFLQNAEDKKNSSIDISPLLGTSFGLGAACNFTRNVGIGVDVLYSKQGRRYETNESTINQKVDYFKVPLMFTFNSNPERTVSFVGKVGPQLSLLIDSRLVDTDGKKLSGDMNDRYESATIGGVINLGAQFRLDKNIFLTAGAKMDYDLSNAEDADYAHYPSGRKKTNNMTLGLEVGLKWSISKATKG